MLKVAVCDDDLIMLDVMSSKIKEYYASECEIRKYEDGKQLLAESRKMLFDVLFLDIDMPDLDGMELAEKLRKENGYTKIIFVTNKEECVFKAYKYGTFRFIRKNYLDEELKEAINDLISVMESENDYIILKTQNGIAERKIINIRYIEVQNHNVIVNTTDGTFDVSGTISEYENQLGCKGFIRVHKSFLVNFRFIYLIGKKDVYLIDQKAIPLSRNRIEITKTKLQIFTRSMRL